MKRILTTAAAALLVVVSFAACGDDDDEGGATSPEPDATTTTTVTDGEGEGEGEGDTLTLVAKDFKFDKTTLTGAAGEPLTILLKNEDTAKHNITIEDLDVDEDAEAGEEATATVDSANAGTYDYFCEYHPQNMKGTLTVS